MGRQAEQHPEKSGPCKAGLPPEPAPTTLDVPPQEMKAHVLAETHTHVLTAALVTTAENWTHQEVL